jgi:glycosyltransferase involved in cell wall biosynthesis
MQKIVHMAEACEVADRIVWLGQLSSDEVFHVLQVSDMMVFPSLSESFGLGLVEAMAAGCPVLAADLRYAHDVCGPAARYFDPTSPKELTCVLIEVWGDPQLRERMVLLGNERKGSFGYETIAERIAHVFESVVCNQGKAEMYRDVNSKSGCKLVSME